jgi:hypothetical protein
MRAESNRPYFNKSIVQLEALLELPGLDNQHFFAQSGRNSRTAQRLGLLNCCGAFA